MDVNVLVSAAIAPLGIPRRLWLDAPVRRFTLVSSDPIIHQTATKLRLPCIARRYDLSDHDIRIYVAAIRTAAESVALTPADIIPVTGDPEDDAVLATARLGRAEYLVTGDRGLLALSPYEGVRIVSPRRFLELREAGQR